MVTKQNFSTEVTECIHQCIGKLLYAFEQAETTFEKTVLASHMHDLNDTFIQFQTEIIKDTIAKAQQIDLDLGGSSSKPT